MILGKPKERILSARGGCVGEFFPPQKNSGNAGWKTMLTFSEQTLLERARSAVLNLELAATPAGRALARRRLEAIKAQIESHHKPHKATLAMIEDALDRAGAAENGGNKCAE